MYFLCLRSNVRVRSERRVTLDAHLRWMRRQHEQGRVIISGPSVDRGRGIYLIRAGSRAEAEDLAAADPFTAAGDATFELIEWDVHQILGVGPFTAAGIHAG